MASKILEEIRVRGKIAGGDVPEVEEMLRVFNKKEAIELLRSVLIKNKFVK